MILKIGIAGAIKVATRQNVYHEVGLESFENKRWYAETFLFSGIFSRCVLADYILLC